MLRKKFFWGLRDAIAELLKTHAPTINFDVSFLISSVGCCVEVLKEIMAFRFTGVRAMFFGHEGDVNVYAVVCPLFDEAVVLDEAVGLDIEAAFYEVVRNKNGSVSAEHGIGLHKDRGCLIVVAQPRCMF